MSLVYKPTKGSIIYKTLRSPGGRVAGGASGGGVSFRQEFTKSSTRDDTTQIKLSWFLVFIISLYPVFSLKLPWFIWIISALVINILITQPLAKNFAAKYLYTVNSRTLSAIYDGKKLWKLDVADVSRIAIRNAWLFKKFDFGNIIFYTKDTFRLTDTSVGLWGVENPAEILQEIKREVNDRKFSYLADNAVII